MPDAEKQAFSIWDVLDKPSLYTGEVRKIIRPVINKKAVVLSVVFKLLFTGLLSFAISIGGYYYLLEFHSVSLQWGDIFIICTLVCYFLLLLIRLKKILIFFVTIYQVKASEEVRLRCVFTPSCSEYMILSLQKYGAVWGLIKGIKRLRRCKYPNGGEDYP